MLNTVQTDRETDRETDRVCICWRVVLAGLIYFTALGECFSRPVNINVGILVHTRQSPISVLTTETIVLRTVYCHGIRPKCFGEKGPKALDGCPIPTWFELAQNR